MNSSKRPNTCAKICGGIGFVWLFTLTAVFVAYLHFQKGEIHGFSEQTEAFNRQTVEFEKQEENSKEQGEKLQEQRLRLDKQEKMIAQQNSTLDTLSRVIDAQGEKIRELESQVQLQNKAITEQRGMLDDLIAYRQQVNSSLAELRNGQEKLNISVVDLTGRHNQHNWTLQETIAEVEKTQLNFRAFKANLANDRRNKWGEFEQLKQQLRLNITDTQKLLKAGFNERFDELETKVKVLRREANDWSSSMDTNPSDHNSADSTGYASNSGKHEDENSAASDKHSVGLTIVTAIAGVLIWFAG